MSDLKRTKNRREFLKDGLRAAVLGGIVFTGLFLGWKGNSSSEEESSCLIDLPCRNCLKLTGCKESRAAKTRKELQNSKMRPEKTNRED
jgi:hypothetical protein